MKALAKFLEKYAGKLGGDASKYADYGGNMAKEMQLQKLYEDVLNVSKLSRHDQKYMRDIWSPEVFRAADKELAQYAKHRDVLTSDLDLLDKLHDAAAKSARGKKIQPWEID